MITWNVRTFEGNIKIKRGGCPSEREVKKAVKDKKQKLKEKNQIS